MDKNEVCSFDKLYQEYVVIPNIKYPDFAPTLEINTDLNYVKSGKSLKVSMPKNDGSFTTYTYTGFSLNKEFVHSVGLDEYDGEQYFSFWIYNDGSSRQRLFIEFFDYGGVKYYKKTDIYVNAGEWHNVRIKMSDLSGNASAMTTGNAGEIYIRLGNQQPYGRQSDLFRFVRNLRLRRTNGIRHFSLELYRRG